MIKGHPPRPARFRECTTAAVLRRGSRHPNHFALVAFKSHPRASNTLETPLSRAETFGAHCFVGFSWTNCRPHIGQCNCKVPEYGLGCGGGFQGGLGGWPWNGLGRVYDPLQSVGWGERMEIVTLGLGHLYIMLIALHPEILEPEDSEERICANCKVERQSQFTGGQRGFWNALPSIFKLPYWDNIRKEGALNITRELTALRGTGNKFQDTRESGLRDFTFKRKCNSTHRDESVDRWFTWLVLARARILRDVIRCSWLHCRKHRDFDHWRDDNDSGAGQQSPQRMTKNKTKIVQVACIMASTRSHHAPTSTKILGNEKRQSHNQLRNLTRYYYKGLFAILLEKGKNVGAKPAWRKKKPSVTCQWCLPLDPEIASRSGGPRVPISCHELWWRQGHSIINDAKGFEKVVEVGLCLYFPRPL
ncbi:hypothetical protein FB451DRAFT_1182497 [Mycena latifolia]|nr:hypothetical protein FB451DRAFT_1182497 [Mycena latifolia]